MAPSPPHSIHSSPANSRPSSPAPHNPPSPDDDPVLHTLPLHLTSTAFPIYLLHHNTQPPLSTPLEARLKPSSNIIQVDYPLARTYIAKEKLDRWRLNPQGARNTLQARMEASSGAGNRFVGRIVEGKVHLVRITGEGHLCPRLGWLDEEVEREKKIRGVGERTEAEAKSVVLAVKGEGQMSKLQKAVRDEEGEVWRRMRWTGEEEAWEVFEKAFGEEGGEMLMAGSGGKEFLDKWM